MAIALTIGLIDWIQKPGYGLDDLALLLVRQLGLGLVVGVVLGALATWAFARLPHSIGAFAPVASVAAGALSFGVADVIGGSGFLAVYLVGLAVGSTPSRYRRQLVAFHEGLAFLAQVVMFVVLGLLVFPHQLPSGRPVGPRARGAARVPDPAGRGLGVDGVQRLHRRASGPCSAGPACAGRSRSCSARSCSPRSSTAARRSSTPSSSSSSSRHSSRERRSSGLPSGCGSSSLAPAVVVAAARGRRAQLARARRLRRCGRPRDRGRCGSRARPAAHGARRGRRARRRDDPAAREHGDRARRPPLRPRSALDARRTSRTSSPAGAAASDPRSGRACAHAGCAPVITR